MVDLDFREHTREHFQPQVWLIPQAVGPALDDPYLIVESFHESQRHLILRLAMGHNPIPVPVYHVGELLIRCQTLPPRCFATPVSRIRRGYDLRSHRPFLEY